jgi:hypothetical protein
VAKAKKKPDKTITEVLAEFLADQEQRLSHRTFVKYQTIVSLFKSYCESYWPGHDGESGSGARYCDTFGPEEIPEGYSEFLGYFMPRKVIAGEDTMRAAGTVTKKLTRWLVEKGYLAADEADDAREDTREMGRDLGACRKVLRLLDQYIDESAPEEVGGKLIEDHFWISRVEPGRLWLDPLLSEGGTLGPVAVPEAVSRLCREGWDIGGVVCKTRADCRFVEVWNVSP